MIELDPKRIGKVAGETQSLQEAGRCIVFKLCQVVFCYVIHWLDDLMRSDLRC